MKYLGIFFLFFFAHSIRAQIITTFAGGGTSLAEGIPATDARIYNPVSGTFDSYGNFYFVQYSSYSKVNKIDSNGILTTIAGIGISGFNADGIPATSAKLNWPNAVAVDTLGNVYISDQQNNRIRKVDALTGIISTIAGNGIAGFSGDSGLATNAKIFLPTDLCFDKQGNLFIGDALRVRKVNTSGIISTYAGNGTTGYSGDNGLATLAEIAPSGLCVDDSSNLYIADNGAGESRIAKVSILTNIITTVAGTDTAYVYNGDNIPATSANISPTRIRFDNNFAHLYFSDAGNNRLREIDSDGMIKTIAGVGVAGFSGDSDVAISAELNNPSGVFFDKCNNMYVGDSYNNRIRKVSFNPSCPPLTVSEITPTQLAIYPNPAYSELNVDNVTTETNYALLNITGIIEQSGTLKKGNNTISIQALPGGVYILQLIDDEGRRTVKKIVKE